MSRPPLKWQTWRFEPWDTWFFKAAEPWDAPGARVANTLFPPPARTVAGAIRHACGVHADVDWNAQKRVDDSAAARKRQHHERIQALGECTVKAWERLRMMGPYVLRNGERLYPVPEAMVLGENDEGVPKLARLYPHIGATSDLGYVRFPDGGSGLRDLRPVTGCWLTMQGMNAFLRGESVDYSQLVNTEDLIVHEPRLGIAIDRQTRTVEEHKLYNTVHARMRDGVTIAARVSGPEGVAQRGNVRFGGEGRLASYVIDGALQCAYCKAEADRTNTREIVIVFVTAASFGGSWHDSHWIKSWVQQEIDADGYTSWKINLLNDITVRVESACVSPYGYEGGYDADSNLDRPVRPLMPAGSVWFCRVLEWRRADQDPQVFDLNELIKRLHGKQLGSERELGRGEIAVGYWRES